MTIRAILFDFDGTLRINTTSPTDVFAEFVIQHGYPLSEEDRQRIGRWEHYYWAQSRELLHDLQHLEFGTPDFWRNYDRRRLVAAGLPPQQAEALSEASRQYMESHYQHQSILPEDLLETLESLKAAGYRMGILSNRHQPYDEEIQALGLDAWFDFALAAGDMQRWKPDPHPFLEACRAARALPDETIYVGDNLYADVFGAQRAGLRPVLYNRRGLFEQPPCPSIQSYRQLLEHLALI